MRKGEEMANKSNRRSEEGPAIGLAWYRREQWPRLLSISDDREDLEPTYDEWLTHAAGTFGDLVRDGHDVRKVDVDTEELLSWCQRRGLAVNGEARADFASEQVRLAAQRGTARRPTPGGPGK